MIKSDSDYRSEATVPYLEIATWRQLVNARTSGDDGEWRKIAEEQVAVIDDSSWTYPIGAAR